MTFPRLNPLCLLAFAAAVLVSCSTDDFDDDLSPQTPTTSSGETITVNVNLSVADSNASSRATDPDDAVVGSDEENMYSWYVIAVDASSDEIAATATGSSTTALTDKEIEMTLDDGSYVFYSFANITESEILSSLGLTSLAVGTTLTEATVAAATFTVAGTGFDVSSNHIPMSGKDTYTTISNGVDLYVYRMLAKVELQLTNGSANTMAINSVTISDITSNVTNNIYLLPDADTSGTVWYCTPNLNTTESDDYTYTLATAETISTNSASPTTVAFYINESVVPSSSLTQYFILTLNVTTTTSDGATSTTDERYALLEWNSIARNDYRVIPITIDDYKLDIIPEDFSAIGVYPASVKEEDGIFTITFHAPGHFHLVPTVTKVSTNTLLDYATSLTTADTWTISDWTQVSTASGLFETSTDVYCTGDNGGAPVWDSLNEYYFGKFAEGVTGTACYTLDVSVLTSSSVSREYTYTVYLIRE